WRRAVRRRRSPAPVLCQAPFLRPSAEIYDAAAPAPSFPALACCAARWHEKSPTPPGRCRALAFWWAERDSNPRPLRCEGIPGPFAPCPPTSANRFTMGFSAPGGFPQRPPRCVIFHAIGSTLAVQIGTTPPPLHAAAD